MHDRPFSHPVIDADGHLLEFAPAIFDRANELAGRDIAAELRQAAARSGMDGGPYWTSLDPEARLRTRTARLPWWALPSRNTLDRATGLLPALLHERLPELGIDFAVLYPSMAIPFPLQFQDAELRRVACRAFNSLYAEVYAPFADRVIPAGIVPMHTPEEAVEELRYAVQTCGLKTLVIPSYVIRTTQDGTGWPWIDTFGLDSEHDYDPFWQACVELGVSIAAHSPAYGRPWNARRSVSNFVYNHIGTFADAGEALCKSLFLGGVTRRFPQLRIAFLEGGVGWGARVYADLVSHWKKRNLAALAHLDPDALDRAELLRLARQYGGKLVEGYSSDDQLLAAMGAGPQPTVDPALRDEFAACRIERAEDIRDLFVEPFFFGCEADDPTTATAFSPANPFGARLGVVFGSDISHWDVQDMTEVVPEAYEEVEKGRLSPEDFRDFVFANAVRFFTDTNPAFFAGTAVEQAVAELLGTRTSAT